MWVNGTDYVTNTQFLAGDMPEKTDAFNITSCWKTDPLINNGYPYISLMLDLPKLELNPVEQSGYICIFCPRSVSGSTVYPQADELLHGNGDAILCPVSCVCDDSLNGMRAVNIVHPADAEGRYKYIKVGAIVRVMGQLFTVMNVDERWNGNSGQVSFYAEAIFYQLNDKFIYPYLEGTHIRLLGFSGEHALHIIDTFTRDEAREGSFSYAFTHASDLPLFPVDDFWALPLNDGCTPVEAILGAGGLIECKGGELYRNNFYYSINERMENASDHAFDIRIGKNLTGIRRVVDISSMVTYFRAYDPWGGLFAIAWDFGEFFGDLFPHYVVRSKCFEFPAEAYDDENWSYDEWFNNVFIPQATAYFLKNGKPIVRYEIDLEDVRNNPDLEIIGDENFRVGDKGQVWDERFGLPLTIEVTGTAYDGIREKCTQVIIGDRQSFVQTAMPAIDWNVVPQIVTAQMPILDADGNFILDADGKQIIQEVQQMPEQAKFNSPWNVADIEAVLDDVSDAKGDSDTLTEKIGTLATNANVNAAVNSGAKNKFYKQADRPATVTDNGVTLAWQPDGTIALSGTASAQTTFYLGVGYDGTAFTPGDILSGVPAASTGLTLCIQLSSSPYTKYANDTGSGARIPATVVAGSTYRILLVIANGTNTTGITVKPMICAPELFDIDKSFQTYAPTNRELYEMIKALQAQMQ